ncbi:helix-turn-helix domain-containing protein [Rugamonas sp. DEMB1]|uniref:helix-turn-helix domain-containing protein n=1 Tax=Rugamonas sp. DEMB1 TaxID=3039386 RepID=UPI002448C41D|nr:helix-turn-helix domain-containing protein [Rugamonas sp. DEMB1]WGG48869.1 helix-turn-helix domain-containing protein [Rugamonas sp. DEMB1]
MTFKVRSGTMFVKSSFNAVAGDLTNMKVRQSAVLSTHLAQEVAHLGQLLARLRHARKVKQADAALRAGLSRNTAYRIEKGDAGLAIGQVLRYLEAIAPGTTLAGLLNESDPSLSALQARESTKRVRDLSAAELDDLNF